MIRFSANLGFLWRELALPDAIRAAASAGFDAVECHFPYETDPAEVHAALRGAGLEMISLNTAPGDTFGLAAQVGEEARAKDAIRQAVDYAAQVDAAAIHVMAGRTDGGAEAEAAFRQNLSFACAQTERMILIEPLNPFDAPGYHLGSVAQAARTISAVGAKNLKIMFDCYHIARLGGDPLGLAAEHFAHIGHIQFAAVPGRTAPDQGEIDYSALLPALMELGWDRPFGAEYRPGAATEDSLGWRALFR